MRDIALSDHEKHYACNWTFLIGEYLFECKEITNIVNNVFLLGNETFKGS